MTRPRSAWRAELTFTRPDRASADRLERVLAPEAAYEIPRARARLSRPGPTTVRLEVETIETGSMRAAMNAYLGWVRLAMEAERVAERAQAPPVKS